MRVPRIIVSFLKNHVFLILIATWSSLLADSTYIVTRPPMLSQEFGKLRAGDTLLIMPGQYAYVPSMTSQYDGLPDHRIVIRATAPNTVFIIHGHEELFMMYHRYYTFENLNIAGLDGVANCHFKLNERAQYIHIRNCKLTQFGETFIKAGAMNTTPDSIFPGDYSIIDGCDISSSVLGLNGNGNGFNLNGPEHMVIRNNWVHDLVRTQGSTAGDPTYAGFFKAGAQHNILEGNVFGPGVGMAFCFGGGCTGVSFFRLARSFETNDIMYRNNVVLYCNTVEFTCGTNLERKLYHNTIISSSGSLVAADCRNNLVMGGNVSLPANGVNNFKNTTYNAALFWAPSSRNFALKSTATTLIGQVPRLDSVLFDAMGTARPEMVSYGAYEAYEENPFIAVETIESAMPEVSFLEIHPNPANPSATIDFQLERDMRYVEIGIYDFSGRTVRVLYDGPRSAGRYSIQWDGQSHTSKTASGTYFVRIRSNDRQVCKRFVFIR